MELIMQKTEKKKGDYVDLVFDLMSDVVRAMIKY